MRDSRIYKQTENCAIYADIYYQGGKTPVIIYIHGGALIFGTRNWLSQEQVELYLNAGFSVVSIDYRLAPETKFELIIEDIQDAITWVRTTATEWYDFDANRIVLIGSSAGAYLSLLIGSMNIKPKAIVSFYGYGDILGEWYAEPSNYYCQRPIINETEARQYVNRSEISDGPWERFYFYLYCRQYGLWVEEVTRLDRVHQADKLVKYNPIDNISIEYPPTLFLHGDKDTDVPFEQSVIMYERLCGIGVQCELITIQDGDHGFDHNFNDSQVQNAFKKILKFLEAYV